MPRERSAVRAQVISPGLVSSGVNLTKKLSDGKRFKIRNSGWQDEAWHFYDVIGEFRYAASWAGNLISKASLYPTKDDAITTDPQAVEAMANLFGGPEGQTEMLRKFGVHLTVAGEAYLVAFDDKATWNSSDWEVLSSSAIQRAGTGFRIAGDDYEDVLVIRIWRSHPRDVKAADAPSRAVLPVLSELETLTKRVAAQVDSRLTGNGILFLPSEVTFPSMPVVENAGDPISYQQTMQANANGVAQLLIEVAEKAIADPASAAAMVPLVFQAPGEYLDRIQHVTFWSELDAQAPELRNEAIKRLALGMDMPPEVLLGTADMNHWNAWQLEEAAIKAHTEPFLQMITDALSEGYLRPYLEAVGVSEEDAAAYGIGADTSKLRLRPNRSKEATELYDRAELSGAALLRENGFDPADAMDDKERIAWFLKKVASGSTTPELVQAALDALGADLLPAPSAAPSTEERPTPSLRDHPVQAPPQVPSETVSDATVAAAEVMVFRALERAGNRLKNKLGPTRPDCPASKLYMRIPSPTHSQVDDMLEDAWSCVTEFTLTMPAALLAQELDTYTRMLLVEQRPHDPLLLRQYLTLQTLAAAS